MAEQAAWRGNQFRLASPPVEDGSEPKLVRQRLARRRRYGWAWWLAKSYVIFARHDRQRDRLVVIDATNTALAEELMASVGWAGAGQAKRMQESDATED